MPKMYDELAAWFPLLTPPSEYVEAAALLSSAMVDASARPVREVLELGSGGGHNASHMKSRFAMTLVDASPAMRALSRTLNPECEHFEGDMRTVRLHRQFDAVFVHDAVCYMCTEQDLAQAVTTYVVDYALVLSEADGSARVEHDRHIEGLFSRAEGIRICNAAGFDARMVTLEHAGPIFQDVIVATRSPRSDA